MSTIKSFPGSGGAKKASWRFFLLLITLGFLLSMLYKAGLLNSAQNFILTIASPIQYGLSFATSSFRQIVDSLAEFRNLRKENERLRKELERLIIENIQLRELEAENRTLRELLHFTQENPIFDYTTARVTARVIGFDPSGFTRYILINAGQKEGIAPGMAVVTERGLVGRVVNVYKNTAKVLLITDPSSSVSAYLQGSQATGMVEGTPDGSLVMRYIPLEVKVSVGEIALTSGLGGTLPKGLVIGQVIEIEKKDYDLFQEVRLKPSVDFDRLELVLVLKEVSH
jgi:rod shape-determining protein MreC